SLSVMACLAQFRYRRGDGYRDNCPCIASFHTAEPPSGLWKADRGRKETRQCARTPPKEEDEKGSAPSKAGVVSQNAALARSPPNLSTARLSRGCPAD